MSDKRPIGAISLGVFLATCGVTGVLYAISLITFWEMFPLIAILNGVWVLILAAIKHASPAKYEMEAFVVAIWGGIILGGGLSWLLLYRISGVAALATFVLILGILAVAAGARAWSSYKK
ncbi:MAG: hypothetical protein QMD10_11505 [Desulfitobacteriaceae bacterium]|nr:hypothetical protein [Desulfitobacteriaceae bacterium]